MEPCAWIWVLGIGRRQLFKKRMWGNYWITSRSTRNTQTQTQQLIKGSHGPYSHVLQSFVGGEQGEGKNRYNTAATQLNGTYLVCTFRMYMYNTRIPYVPR